jgi:hypothetical protein
MDEFFIEFEIAGEDRFRRLATVFGALRAAKESDEWRDDGYWLAFFDQEALSHFWWPTAAEAEEQSRRWFATPVPQRFTDPSLVTPWYFGSMIEAFRHGDYELLQCERVSENVGRLSFYPYGWPYGGTGCMRALVESFGHRITVDSEAWQTRPID